MTWCPLRSLLATLLAWLALAGAVHAQVQVLANAQATTTTADGTVVSAVTLPYHWDRRHRDEAGAGTFEIPFSLPQAPTGPMALYVPRVGNAYEFWVNDVLIQRRGDLARPDTDDYAKAPHMADIPAKLLRRENVLRVRIRADSGRRGGLAVVTLGPEAEVAPLYNATFRSQTVASLIIMILSLLVGGTALALWLTQRHAQKGPQTRDSLYLFVCLAEFSWALRLSDGLIERPPLPWPQWSMVMALSAACWMGCMMIFCCHVARWTAHPLARRSTLILWLFLAAGVLSAALGSLLQSSRPLSLWYGASSALFIPFTVCFCWAAVQRGVSSAQRVVALATLANAVTGLRDLVVFRLSDSYGGQTWVRYSSVLFGLTLAYIVIHRFRSTGAALHELLGSLAAQVAHRERELRQSYAQVEQLAREQERAAERTRILRDMHDGVGSHISAAIRQLQSGKATSDAVVQTLRGSLDQLKLSIDAMNLPPGDVTALLASLRYRLEPRLAASDLELQWDVDQIQPLRGIDAAGMRHLQFMVFEALSNVLQHAQARMLRIEAQASATGAQLRIIDNGRGFDASLPPRKGLLSMQERAAAIGAHVWLQSEPGRTVVNIVLA